MGLNPVDIGLAGIVLATLIGPFVIDRVERNLEAFLFLMGACAVALSRTWQIGLVEEALQSPVVIAIVLSVLLAGAIVRYRRPHPDRIGLSDGITLKVVFFEIVVVLGLLASIITPIIPFFVLVEVVHRIPIEKRARASLMILACLSVGLGVFVTPAGEPLSTIANTKIQGETLTSGLLSISGLISMNLMPYMLLLGLISTLVPGRPTSQRHPSWKSPNSLNSAAKLCARACLFAGALLLVGGAFGVNF